MTQRKTPLRSLELRRGQAASTASRVSQEGDGRVTAALKAAAGTPVTEEKEQQRLSSSRRGRQRTRQPGALWS